MMATGELTAERAFADRRAHSLVGWLGADADDMAVHVAAHTPPGPGMVLVCSDGLWNYLPEAGPLAAATFADPDRGLLDTARALVRYALDAGGHDNITVALIPFADPRERTS